MIKKKLYAHFHHRHPESYGRRLAIFLAVFIHIAVLGGLWVFSHPPKPKPNIMRATPVTLATNPNRASGKKSKAPVAGRKRSAKPKKTNQTKNTSIKKSSKDIGTKRDKKPITKKLSDKPPESKRNPPPKIDPSPSEVAEEPEVDRTIPIARGGFGGLQDSGISFEMGSPNQDVDVKNFEFASYFRLVHEQVARRWSRGGLIGGITTIRFEIHRDGAIKDTTIIQSAGKPYLDNPAKLAVIGAELPPLPQGIREDILIVDINFHYHNLKP